jgi:hypothetical protein
MKIYIIILILVLCSCILFFYKDGFFVLRNTDNSINSLIILSNNECPKDNSIDDYI